MPYTKCRSASTEGLATMYNIRFLFSFLVPFNFITDAKQRILLFYPSCDLCLKDINIYFMAFEKDRSVDLPDCTGKTNCNLCIEGVVGPF